MNVKNYFLVRLKILYLKIRWIIDNYSKISPLSELRPNHYLGKITYDTDSLTTSNNSDFITEPRFARAYAAAQATKPWEGFTLQWRVYIICWMADHVKKLPGDFVECGVNTGAYSRAIVEYTEFKTLGKKFFLLDTFEGFPEEQMTEAERKAGIGMYGGTHYKNVHDQVVATFKDFPVVIIKGRVPETLVQCQPESVTFLSIDMNAVQPELAAADYFWPLLVSGGVMVLDDYGFPPHINQKLAFDEFAVRQGVSILSLPTGQGIVFKP